MQTLQEHFGELRGLKLAFVGDGNNVAQSLMLCAARLGIHFALANPPNYDAHAAVIEQARTLAARTGATITLTNDPAAAVHGAHAVYTDVWASMGAENEAAERRTAFSDYQVDDELFDQAEANAIFMHCLPAKRGEEVTDSVVESPRSVVFDQAENRLHAQKALLLMPAMKLWGGRLRPAHRKCSNGFRIHCISIGGCSTRTYAAHRRSRVRSPAPGC